MFLCQRQNVLPLLLRDGPMAPADTVRQQQPLCRVVDDEPGTAGLPKKLLHDHPQLGHMGVGAAGLAVEDRLQMQIPHLPQPHLPHGGGNVAPVFLIIQAQALGGESRRVLVGGLPLEIPAVYTGVSAESQFAPFQRRHQLSQLLTGFLLRLAPHLIAVALPSDRLPNVHIISHNKPPLIESIETDSGVSDRLGRDISYNRRFGSVIPRSGKNKPLTTFAQVGLYIHGEGPVFIRFAMQKHSSGVP